jgi:hypothetical protein
MVQLSVRRTHLPLPCAQLSVIHTWLPLPCPTVLSDTFTISMSVSAWSFKHGCHFHEHVKHSIKLNSLPCSLHPVALSLSDTCSCHFHECPCVRYTCSCHCLECHSCQTHKCKFRVSYMSDTDA